MDAPGNAPLGGSAEMSLTESMERRDSDEVTSAMDRVCEHLEEGGDRFVAEAARRVLENAEWSLREGEI